MFRRKYKPMVRVGGCIIKIVWSKGIKKIARGTTGAKGNYFLASN